MEFQKVLELRQSVRAYTDEPVSKEDIKELVKAVQYAPVGMHNNKGYLVTVISSKAVLDTMRETYKNITGRPTDPTYGAPLFILVSETPDVLEELKKYDAACIIENLHLAATDIGLGSVYIHGMIFAIKHAKEWQKLAGLPENVTPICGISIGHSKTEVKPRPEKAVFDVSYAE